MCPSGLEANVHPLPTAARSRRAGGRFSTACAWCKRIRVQGVWLERDEALPRLRRPGLPEPEFTHGICGPCLQALIGSAPVAGEPQLDGPRAA